MFRITVCRKDDNAKVHHIECDAVALSKGKPPVDVFSIYVAHYDDIGGNLTMKSVCEFHIMWQGILYGFSVKFAEVANEHDSVVTEMITYSE